MRDGSQHIVEENEHEVHAEVTRIASTESGKWGEFTKWGGAKLYVRRADVIGFEAAGDEWEAVPLGAPRVVETET